MRNFSQMLCEELKTNLNYDTEVQDFTKGDRFAMFKIGPIISASVRLLKLERTQS